MFLGFQPSSLRNDRKDSPGNTSFASMTWIFNHFQLFQSRVPMIQKLTRFPQVSPPRLKTHRLPLALASCPACQKQIFASWSFSRFSLKQTETKFERAFWRTESVDLKLLIPKQFPLPKLNNLGPYFFGGGGLGGVALACDEKPEPGCNFRGFFPKNHSQDLASVLHMIRKFRYWPPKHLRLIEKNSCYESKQLLINTLPKTDRPPLKIDRLPPKRKNLIVSQPFMKSRVNSLWTLRRRLTWQWKIQPFEDVSPIKPGDFPACHVSLLEGNSINKKSNQFCLNGI